jgi:ankyrin repeat protein
MSSKEFIRSAKSGNVEKLKTLLESDPTLLNLALDTDGSTALHYGAWKGQWDVVSFLIEAGADVNIHNHNEHWGTTPLHAAAHANQAKISRMLLDAGAEVNATDQKGQTPLRHTVFHKATAAAKVIREHGGIDSHARDGEQSSENDA